MINLPRRTTGWPLGTRRNAAAKTPAPSARAAVAGFMAASLVAVVAFASGALLMERHLAKDQAVEQATESAQLIGRGIIGPLMTDAAMRGEPAALAELDRVVRERVLGGGIVRIKVWDSSGRIVFSDRAELIGQRYDLAPDDLAAFASDRADGEVSDLTLPENRLERPFGKLLEVYLGVDSAAGERVLVESYSRFDAITATSKELWVVFAPILLGMLLLLWLSHGPLAWSLARRLQRGERERQRLREAAASSSELERRRIAADLHDGVVQRLAGTAYSLAAAIERMPGAAQTTTRRFVEDAAVGIRQAMRELRSLIVEIHPPALADEGLGAALRDLIAPLPSRGLDAQAVIELESQPQVEVEKLLYRGAQEAVRNVIAHAGATTLKLTITEADGNFRLTVEDNGRGFDAAERLDKQRDYHVGLTLLGELASNVGGTLEVDSSPGTGTRFTLEAPCESSRSSSLTITA